MDRLRQAIEAYADEMHSVGMGYSDLASQEQVEAKLNAALEAIEADLQHLRALAYYERVIRRGRAAMGLPFGREGDRERADIARAMHDARMAVNAIPADVLTRLCADDLDEAGNGE